MTFDEVKEKITNLVSDPDKAAENAVSLLSDLESDYTNMESMAEKSKADDSRIRELQDTNQKLFLSVTGSPKEEEEEEEEKEPGIDWDKILSDDGKEKNE